MLIEEIRLLEARVAQLERELATLAKLSPACTTLLSIPGIGLLTATAMVAATSGDVSHFKDVRHFSSWFGLTPKEYSSGSTRPGESSESFFQLNSNAAGSQAGFCQFLKKASFWKRVIEEVRSNLISGEDFKINFFLNIMIKTFYSRRLSLMKELS